MKKFKEFDLSQNLQDFKEKASIELEFEQSLTGKLIFEEATVKYDRENGYINLESKNGNLKINTTLVYGYAKEENQININLDDLLIKIRKSPI